VAPDEGALPTLPQAPPSSVRNDRGFCGPQGPLLFFFFMAHEFKLSDIKVPKSFKVIIAILAVVLIIALAALLFARIALQTASQFGLVQTVVTNCTDSDGGKIDTEQGLCTDSLRKTYSDTCVLTGVREKLKLQEYFCKDNKCTSEITTCQTGFACVAGKCVKE